MGKSVDIRIGDGPDQSGRGSGEGGGSEHAPNCFYCAHFYVTWDPKFPRGCRAFGVKTKDLPSRAVHQATGRHCPVFKPSSR